MLIAVHALMVQESALSVTSNNIANANTPGSSRQVAVLSESRAGAGGWVSPTAPA